MLRVRVDRHRCVGAATCMFLAPTAFVWRDGKADVITSGTVEDEPLHEAARACPTQAITVEAGDESKAQPAMPSRG
jgi:ferredoxin